jgi:hypothetical protein
MTDKEFIKYAYKIAFGNDAKLKDHSREQVIGRLLSIKDTTEYYIKLAYDIELDKLD